MLVAIENLQAIMFPEHNRPTVVTVGTAVMRQEEKPAGGTKPKISQLDEPDCLEALQRWNQNDRRFYE